MKTVVYVTDEIYNFNYKGIPGGTAYNIVYQHINTIKIKIVAYQNIAYQNIICTWTFDDFLLDK